MGRLVILLAFIGLSGCSWLDPWHTAAVDAPPGGVAFFDPVSGTSYQITQPCPLCARNAELSRLARIDVPDAAQAADAPIIAATPAPRSVARALATTAPLQLDHEFTSITRMVPFASGRATLGPRGRMAVAELAPIAHQARQVVVAGRTDATGSARQNEALARQRAETVARAFIEAGVDNKRIVTGHCTECFVADNDSRQGRSLNRRVDVSMELTPQQVAALPEPVWAHETPPLLLSRTLTVPTPHGESEVARKK